MIIPAEGDHPTIKVFESLDELARETGQSVCHGFFDVRAYTIMATADSVAHEIGHFLDIKSKKFKDLSKATSLSEKIEASLRNEIVAVLFAYSKCLEGGTSLSYETQFIEWLKHSRKHLDFGPHPKKELSKFSFREIQDLAEWLTDPKQSWFKRLTHFFRSYLADEARILTYGQKSLRLF